MRQWFSSTRIGPMVGLLGSIIVFIFFFQYGEWGDITFRGIIEPMVALIPLAALAVFGLSAAALVRPFSPVLRGLGLIAASVGLFALLYGLFEMFMSADATLMTFPRFFLWLYPDWWILLPQILGFLLSGCGMVLAAKEGERQLSSQERAVKENRWSIGRRHILAMIIGVILYSVLSNIFILWEGPGEENFQIVYPAFALVLYFGIVYGPWVGLVIGGIGTFLNNAISIHAHASYWMLSNYGTLSSRYSVPAEAVDASHPHVYWPLVVGSALVGFLVGLPLFGAERWDKSVCSLLDVMIRSAFAIVVGFSLSAVLFDVGVPVSNTLLDIQNTFTYQAIPTLLVVMLLLPLLLVLFPAKTLRRRVVQTSFL